VIALSPLTTAEEWTWIHSRAHPILCGDTCGMVARNARGIIVAIVLFDSFTPVACNVHMAIESPMVLRHGFFESIAHYTFIERNRQRLFGLVPSTNEKALKLNYHLGMKHIATIPNALEDGVHYEVLGLEKSECRWLPERMREAA